MAAATTTTPEAPEKIEQAEVIREGKAIVIPDGMDIGEAIVHLERRKAYEEETTAFKENVDCFPQDGAVALSRVLMRRYGWAQAEPTPGWFGSQPPQMVGVEIGTRLSLQVPWGRFTLPNIKGYIETGTEKVRGRMVFSIHATVLRKHEADIREIAAEVREEVRTNSIYRGKSMKLSFGDESSFFTGHYRVANITFLNVDGIDSASLVYSQHVENAILTNLITPLEHYLELPTFGIPFKRGVLLSGKFGTGKTLAALFAANRANANGITFVYVEKSADFAEAVVFARQYQPAVVFCEDIDRVTAGERNADLDSVLNIVDGIDSKFEQVMVVLTTNAILAIHQSMLRPGRLDALIEVEPPDAAAVRRLIVLYGHDLIDENATLVEVGHLLEGQIPAVIREVVERSKLAALRLGNKREDGSLFLTDAALVDSAHTMRMQIEMLNRVPAADPTEMELFGKAFGRETANGLAMLARAFLLRKPAALVTADGDDEFSGSLVVEGEKSEVDMNYGEVLGSVSPLPRGAMQVLAGVAVSAPNGSEDEPNDDD